MGRLRQTAGYRRYEAVLRTPRALPLIVGAFVARTEIGGMGLALVLLVHGTTGSYRTGGAAVALYLVTASANRPVQGRLMDRHGRVRLLRLLAGAHLACVVLLAASAAAAPAPVVLALCAAAGLTLPSLSAFVRAAWAAFPVPPEVLGTAYALDSVLYELALVCGPLLVGVLVAAVPAAVVPVVLGGLAFAGTVLATRAPADASASPRAAPPDAPAPGALGGMARLVGALVAVGLALGAIAVVVPATAQASGAIALSGPVQASWSVGSLAGGLWYGSRAWSGPPARRAAVATVWFTAFLALFALSPNLLWRALMLLTAGTALAPALTAVLSLVPVIVPASRLAEAFSWVSAAEPAGAALGSWAAGTLVAAHRLTLAGWLPCAGAAGAVLFAATQWHAMPRVPAAAAPTSGARQEG